MIAVLAGGTGAAKFVRGLTGVVRQNELAIIVNTGDDLQWWGLHVSPDIDTLIYCLAGCLDQSKGWGVSSDSFACLDQMSRFDEPTWFNVGDRDLALHLYRTRLLSEGQSLTEATRRVAEGLGVEARVLPMSDQSVRTMVHTPHGSLSFQEFFVRDRYKPEVIGVEYRNDCEIEPGPMVLETIRTADAIIIGPSNPITSIGPILSVPGIRQAVCEAAAPVVCVSPIVGGSAVTGPAGQLMQAEGFDVSVAGVAKVYEGLLDVIVADSQDASQQHQLEAMGVTTCFTNTIMYDKSAAVQLAGAVLKQSSVVPKSAG